MITEPATTLTDYAMAALAVAFAVDLRRRAAAAPHVRAWSTAFFLLAASALCGGTFHGFRTSLAPWVVEALWRASLATASLASFATMRALALQWLGEPRARPWIRLALLKLTAALLAGALHPEFVVVVADFGLTLAFGLAAATFGRSTDLRAFGLLCTGIALFVLGAVIQQARLSPHPAFNHNDVFHVIQILGNACFFLSASEARRTRTSSP